MSTDPQSPTPSTTRGLEDVAAAARVLRDLDGREPRGLPPVHLWNPPHCGEIDIRIARDGRWYHEGAVIGREPLVRLFSTVLRRDPDGVYLVTPVEKLRIEVEDAPFMAVRVDRIGGALRFLTNVGDEVEAGPAHPLHVDTVGTGAGGAGEPAPYVHVRGGLDARLTRPVFYELVEMAEARDTAEGTQLAVESLGVWFPLGPPGLQLA